MRADAGRMTRGWARTFVLAAFAVLALLFAGLSVATVERMRLTEQHTRSLVDDMLQSVALVSEMGRDAARERLLVDEHIFEKRYERMRQIEAELVGVQANFRATASSYQPLVTQPGEAESWGDLQRDLAEVRAPVAHILELSRENRDQEAFELREGLDESFRAVDGDVDALVRINREGAATTVAEIASRQRASAWFVGTLGAVGLGLTLLLGAMVYGFVQSREERLRGYSAELETRNRDLDAFAGRVAHDLRGPLATVGFASARLKRHRARENGTIAVLDRAVGRMEDLIDDLLTLSRLGTPQPECAGDPAQAVAEVQEDMATRLRAEDVRLSVQVDPVPVRCPAGLLREALFNLADNALKYRRPDVPLEVDIEGHPAADRYELSVRDNGVGMSAEQTRRVFEPFYRGAQVRDRPGTGLGLSIVRRIVEATGGTVRVASVPGRGSEFTVTLPVAEAARR